MTITPDIHTDTVDRAATNRAAFEQVLDAANSHDAERIAEAIDNVFVPDVRMNTPLPIKETGTDALKQVFVILQRSFPDLHIAAEETVAEGDTLVSRHKVTGTHLGADYLGKPASGIKISYDEVFVLHFDNGRVVECRGVVDVLAQMKQLGVIGAPAER